MPAAFRISTINRQATCSCQALKISCNGDPLSVSLCHCVDCQKRTGSAFGIAAFYERTAIEVTGEESIYKRGSDSGFEVTFHFCPSCGSSVYWEPERRPALVAVAVGAFGDSNFPAPSKQVYCSSRHAWLNIDVVEG